VGVESTTTIKAVTLLTYLADPPKIVPLPNMRGTFRCENEACDSSTPVWPHPEPFACTYFAAAATAARVVTATAITFSYRSRFRRRRSYGASRNEGDIASVQNQDFEMFMMTCRLHAIALGKTLTVSADANCFLIHYLARATPM
jgi:hypothetical protein